MRSTVSKIVAIFLSFALLATPVSAAKRTAQERADAVMAWCDSNPSAGRCKKYQ